jgi:fructose-1,6-bisphosphatase/inositol monophosphatase family enzyme
MSQAADLSLAHALADAAGAAIRPFFRAPYQIDSKEDASPVTEADRAAELAMRALIEQTFPDDGIIGEEYGTVRESAGGSGCSIRSTGRAASSPVAQSSARSSR